MKPPNREQPCLGSPHDRTEPPRPPTPSLGSILAAIQRAQMIVNQRRSKSTTMQWRRSQMNGQLTELTDQFSHLKEQALGTVGALTQPFTDLSSVPTEFIGEGLSWKNDFTGVAGELAGAVEQLGESEPVSATHGGTA